MKVNFKYTILFLFFSLIANAQSQNFWYIEDQASQKANLPKSTKAIKYLALQFDFERFTKSTPSLKNIQIPNPEGVMTAFEIQETPIFSTSLSNKYPQFKSYTGKSSDGKHTLKLSYSPYGIHAMVISLGQEPYYIDPVALHNSDNYLAYYKSDLKARKIPFTCLTKSAPIVQNEQLEIDPSIYQQKIVFGDCKLRTYRLALACTGEYAAFHGGTIEKVLAAYNASMTRVNGVYERDAAVRMILVDNTDKLIFLTASTDPYSNNDGGAMLSQNQTTCNNLIGIDNYDIGHVFSTGGGGIAQLRAPCSTSKAEGVTGQNSPIGDAFDIDYVAHEMGHQFGANHTFNNSCDNNINDDTAVEPGSGSSIMGYAGICAPDVAPNSDAHFHAISIKEISDFITSNAGNRCAVQVDVINNPPVISVKKTQYTIPGGTSFFLEATSEDIDNDVVTYCWEQTDFESAPMPPKANSTKGPTFRSIPPKLSGRRYFPDLEKKYGQWEVLPTVARVLNFRCVARDNHVGKGCTDEANIKVNVIANGPFLVTNPNNAGISWKAGSNQTITWDKAMTDIAPINTPFVDIYLSTDGGKTYPHLLIDNVLNDGSQEIITPSLPSSTAKIMVVGKDNIFFDVSNVNFTITTSFSLNMDVSSIELCGETQKAINLTLSKIDQIDQNITLSTSALPQDITATFSINPVNLPGESVLTLNNLDKMPYGLTTITIFANTVAEQLNRQVAIYKNNNSPIAVTTTNPTNGSDQISNDNINFSWLPVDGIKKYQFELAENPSFQTLKVSKEIQNTNILLSLDPGKIYFWRVRAISPCVQFPNSLISSFRTIGNVNQSAILLKNEYLIVLKGQSGIIDQSKIDFVTNNALMSSILINELPSHGTLLKELQPINLGGVVSFSDIISGKITYQNDNLSTATSDSFAFDVIDDQNRWLPNNTFKIAIIDQILGGAAVILSPILCHNSTGSIKIDVLGGQSPYQYSIDGGMTFTNENTFMSLLSGTYSFVIKDNLNNSANVNSINLNQPLSINIDLVSNLYDINVNAIGGTGNLVYSSDNLIYFSDPKISDPGNGLLTVFVKDENGCIEPDTLTINISPLEIVATIKTDIKCNGQKAAITTQTVGGFTPYKYSSNGTTFQNSPNFSLSAGTYNLTVQDAGGKKIASQEITTKSPTAIVISFTNKKFEVTTMATGGTAPYTFSKDGNIFSPDSVISYSNNGSYKLYVKDSLSCQKTLNFTLNVLVSGDVISTNPTCYNTNTGTIRITPNGGQVPFQYSFNGGNYGSAREFTNLSNGIYPFSIIDNRSDTVFGSATLVGPDSLYINPVIDGDDITFEAGGGVPPYNYSIDGEVFILSNIFNDLPSGNYNLTVKDKNGCIATNAAIISSTADGSLNDEIIVSPNPSNGEFNMILPANISTTESIVHIYTIEGKLITTFILPAGIEAHKIDLQKITSNHSILRLYNKNVSYHKLIEIIK